MIHHGWKVYITFQDRHTDGKDIPRTESDIPRMESDILSVSLLFIYGVFSISLFIRGVTLLTFGASPFFRPPARSSVCLSVCFSVLSVCRSIGLSIFVCLCVCVADSASCWLSELISGRISSVFAQVCVVYVCLSVCARVCACMFMYVPVCMHACIQQNNGTINNTTTEQ